MRWHRVMVVWLLIIIAETVHGIIRQILIAPAIGDMRARQIGVLIGSAMIFVIAWACIRWMNAKSFAEQFRVGLIWVVLTAVFELSLGTVLGYSPERLLSEYNVADGGFLGFGMLFLLFAPALAAKVRGLGQHSAKSQINGNRS